MASTLQEIQKKAAVDSAFRAALTADPKGTLVAEGIPVPESVTIEVIEAGFNHLPLVIPPCQRGELSEKALAGMVGGSATVVSGDFINDFIGG